MKRYLVFSGDDYYPRGGWLDFKGSFDTINQAIDRIRSLKCDWYQVIDSETEEAVRKHSF